MPHSSDDLPGALRAESVNSETPGASAPNTLPENVSDSSPPSGPVPQESERRRRRRRRRRPPPPPAAELAAAGGSEAPAEETASTSNAAAPASAPLGDDGSVRPPFRRSRRRRPPRQTPLRPEPAEGSGQAGEDIPAGDAAEGAAPEGLARQDSPSVPGPDERSSEHRRPRRRRRRPVPAGDGAGPRAGSEAGTSSEAVVEVTVRSDSAPSLPRVPERGGWGRMGRPHNRRPRDAGPRQEPRDAGSRQQRRTGDGEPRATSRREPDRRERTSPRRGVAGRNAKTRPTGRGREAVPRKPEQKLYALESIVDRGFEDVTDEADENAARRVHWAIVKRTVADQKSGKPMSAVYVLQREGVEAQYPNLGAARAAVNKTIVHPEKLTVSKAEHAAERAAAKK
jgi:hypothetical protein